MKHAAHTITVATAADLLGMDRQTVRRRMEDKSLDIGVVLPGRKKNTYLITAEKFEKVTGINPNERGKE